MAGITDRQARAGKAGDKHLPAGVPGVTLQPTGKGAGKWNLRFVSPVTGKRRDMGLGTYPETGIADALAAGRLAREAITKGQDPIEKRRALAVIPTFEQAARARWEMVAPTFKNAKHRAQWITTLETYVFPELGARRVDTLTPQDFARVLGEIWLKVPETASRTKQRCADVMAACWAAGHTQGNPLDVVHLLLAKPAAKIDQHHPAMPWALVSEFVKAHLSRPPLVGGRACLLFTILTAVRSKESRGATWGEIDLKSRLWSIPAERMKAGRAHTVPLSAAALALLAALPQGKPGELIFPALRKGNELSDMALTSLLRKAKAPSDTPGRVATAHGFRTSFRTWCADQETDRETAERALSHTIGNKVQAAYERTSRLQARTDLMERWGNFVMGVNDD